MQTASILTIPLNVLTTVLGLLAPSDVIQARQTCKNLRDASLRHTVWASVMCQVMLEHNIPSRIFPLKSLKRQTLEHLALSPRRFCRKLIAASEGVSKTISPFSAQYALYDPAETELAALGIETLLQYQWLGLCPGGRFLVTSRAAQKTNGGSRSANFIQLWDLGTAGAVHCPRVVACLVPDPPGGKEYHWAQDYFTMGPSETGIHILVKIYRQRFVDAATQKAELGIARLHIDLSAPNLQIFHAGSGTTEERVLSPIIWRDERYYGISRTGAYSRDETKGEKHAIGWKISKSDGDKVNAITLFGDRLFVLKHNQLVQWAMPTTPHDPDQMPVCTYANLLGAMNASDIEHRLHLTPFNPWAMGSPGPDYLVLFQARNLAVYRMEAHPMQAQDTSPDIFPRCIRRHTDMYDIATSSYSPAGACDGQLVFTSCNSEPNAEMRIHLAPTDKLAKPVGCVKTKWMGPRRITALQHALCPATGRMCILTSNNEVLILDFLDLPSSLLSE